jgi:hypothetical protein
MHTTTVLCSRDFQYWQIASKDQQILGDFAACWPHYHHQDRIGVVAPCLATGICQTGYALLALTTAFYDVLRQRSPTFYDYPHHFAFLDVNDDGVSTAGRRVQLDLAAVGSPWGALDVWPESNWIVASGTVDGMLKKVFDWQINHLFWPEAFMPGPRAAAFPDYVRKLLAARLKTVYYYNTTCPTLELRVSPPVEAMRQRSIGRLPQVPDTIAVASWEATPSPDPRFPYRGRYRQVRVQDFLTAMQPCFADGT